MNEKIQEYIYIHTMRENRIGHSYSHHIKKNITSIITIIIIFYCYHHQGDML